MKVVISFNKKLLQWTILFDKIVIFSFLFSLSNTNEKNYSFIFKNYLKVLKLLRQFGLKKPLKNTKQY